MALTPTWMKDGFLEVVGVVDLCLHNRDPSNLNFGRLGLPIKLDRLMDFYVEVGVEKGRNDDLQKIDQRA